MLTAVRPGEELDNKKLIQFLLSRKLIESEKEELSIQQFTNGYSNLTYLLSLAKKKYVLRCPPSGAIKRGHDMGREYRVLKGLGQQFEYVPEVYDYTEDLEIIGKPFYLMEKMDGIILSTAECKRRKLSTQDFAPISKTWLNLYVELHQVDYKAVGLEDLGKPEGYVERQVRNWGKQYLRAATMDIPDALKVIKWMDENQPKEYQSTLIHNDYKYDNVVFENEEWKNITAILDWEMSTLGDPLMDLGTSLGYWVMQSDGPAAHIIPSPTAMEGNPSREDIVQSYHQLSGRDVGNVLFYYVYGLFKIAVIVQQIFYRYNKGLTSNEKFAKLDKACLLFCQMAAQAIDKKRIQNYM